MGAFLVYYGYLYLDTAGSFAEFFKDLANPGVIITSLLSIAGTLGCIAFGWITQGWHKYPDLPESDDAFLDVGTALVEGEDLAVNGWLRAAHSAALAGTVAAIIVFSLSTITGMLPLGDMPTAVFPMRLVIALGALYYLVRTFNLRKIKLENF